MSRYANSYRLVIDKLSGVDGEKLTLEGLGDKALGRSESKQAQPSQSAALVNGE